MGFFYYSKKAILDKEKHSSKSTKSKQSTTFKTPP